jgi:hypothetical protein
MKSELQHRCHEAVQNYWNELRGKRVYPSENDIDPDALGKFWDSCFLVSIDSVTHRLGYRYSYLGNELIIACGGDAATPDVAMQLLSTRNMPLQRQLDQVRESKGPVTDENEFTNAKHLRVKYRACMLPLGYDDKHVSHILGCMRWKVC